MAQIIKNGITDLLDKANAEVKMLSISEAGAVFDKDDYVFVDLRDIREIQRSGKIPGAFSCPRGMLEFWIDPQSPYPRISSIRIKPMYFTARAHGAQRSARKLLKIWDYLPCFT